MREALFRSLVYPAYHRLKGDGIYESLQQLMRSQYESRTWLEQFTSQKLSHLLNHAARHVPYYRRLFKSAGVDGGDSSVDAMGRLEQLPILTKALIRENLPDLKSDVDGSGVIRNTTSGSSGTPLVFFMDRNSVAFRQAAEIRSNSFTGWNLGEKTASIWGAAMDTDRRKTWRGRIHQWVTNHRSFSSFDLGDDSLRRYLNQMQKFRPRLLVAYPGPIEQFARFCERHGEKVDSLRAIVCSAETLWPHQRELVEKVFAVPVQNRYGSREFGQIAAECVVQSGLHVSMERVVLEIVDDEGRACAPGETGRVLITDLDNFGMPFLRYEIGDIATWGDKGVCECGRALRRLAAIEGRTLEIVLTPDGRRIGGTFWTLLLRSRPAFKAFQVRQKHIGGIEIHYVPSPDMSADSIDYFREQIAQKCGANFDTKFIERDSIPIGRSGKQQLVKSELQAASVESTSGCGQE